MEQVGQQLLNTGTLLSKVIASVIIIIVLLLVKNALNKLVIRRDFAKSNAYVWRKIISYSIAVLMVLSVGAIWLYGIKNLATFLGLLVAGLIVALQEPLVNIAGWLFILARHPITLGDRVEINNIKGDVIDLGPLYFSMIEVGHWVDADQSTGRIIHIPNRTVFSHAIANYTQQFPYIWDELPILITFESNWEKAKKILEEIVAESAQIITEKEEQQLKTLDARYYIKLGKLTPIVYTSISDSGVLLTVRYLTPVRQRRTMEEDVWESILRSFKQEEDIAFAYPTQRVFYNPREGKTRMRGAKAERQP